MKDRGNLMKRNIFLIIIAVISTGLLITSCNQANNQNIKKNNNDTFSVTEYKVPKEVTGCISTSGKSFLQDKFYPIGWSKDGKFAFIKEPADDPAGYYYFSFIIFDAETNKIVFNWKIDLDDKIEKSSINEVWEKNKDHFFSMLIKNKIEQSFDFQRKIFPLKIKDAKYSITAQIDFEKDKSLGINVVKKARFFLQKNQEKEMFYNQIYSDNLILNIWENGYIKNPFDNHAVILINLEERGYEGPPHTIRLDVAGLSFN